MVGCVCIVLRVCCFRECACYGKRVGICGVSRVCMSGDEMM